MAVVFAVGIRPGWSSFSLFVLHSSLHDRNEEVGVSGGRRREWERVSERVSAARGGKWGEGVSMVRCQIVTAHVTADPVRRR